MGLGRFVLLVFSILYLIPINAKAVVYYVGPVSAGCVFEGPTAGTSKTPFCLIANAVESARAGDTVRILPGVYNEPRTVTLTYSGTASNPITIEGSNATIIGPCDKHPCHYTLWKTNYNDSAFRMTNIQHIHFKGITIKNYGRRGIEINQSDFITVSNMGFESLGGSAVLALGAKDLNFSNNFIKNVNLGALGDWIDQRTGYWVYWKDNEAVTAKSMDSQRAIFRQSERILFASNVLEGTFHEGFTFGMVNHSVMFGNRVRQSCSTALYMLEGDFLAMISNQAKEGGVIEVPADLDMTALFRSRGYPLPSKLPSGIVNCPELAGMPYGVQQGGGAQIGTCDLNPEYETKSATNIFVAGNLFHDSIMDGFSTYDHCERTGRQGEMKNIFVYHNTFHSIGSFRNNIPAAWIGKGTKDAVFSNNLFSSLNISLGISPERTQNILNFNNHSYQTNQGRRGTNHSFGDPDFISPSTGNFQLGSNSKAANRGSFARPVELNFPVCGSAPDAGAYERCP